MSGSRVKTASSRLEAKPRLAGRKVTVVGLGLTGEAAAEFLIKQGARVTVTDARAPEDQAGELAARARKLAGLGATLELGGHQVGTFTGADLILLSPGVPPSIEPMIKARVKGVPVTGEIELASRFVAEPLVAVTGTNGKTTTTHLLGEMFKAAGREVFVGGNIGRPLIGHVLSGREADVAVIEVSSFQLETAETFKPKVAALLNVTPDHMDRYADGGEYLAAKARIFARQEPDDFAVMNADDVIVAHKSVQARRLDFSRLRPQTDGAYLKKNRLVLVWDGRGIGELPLSGLALKGAHNQENILAAWLGAVALGVEPEIAGRAAAAFRGLPHRVELVAEIKGVRYYDDSKGTNVGAVMKALEGFSGPVVLIAGGRDKAGDFRPLRSLIRDKVKLLILLGEAKETMAAVLGRETETILVEDMARAVILARSRARRGDVVLLSPACASFDMFQDYAHRGRVFAGLVREFTDGGR
ncbi:MAG: UDP-N-acetylmuramoyl-L-alanine--D-glutamate ligase [Thermodesulfobacteriota bacterium]